MHFYDGGCGKCGRYKGDFLGKLPRNILGLREEVVRKKFPGILKRLGEVRKGRNMMLNSSIHLCDRCWEAWRSPVRVDWGKVLKDG